MPILPENPLPAATSAQTADLPPIVPDHTLLRCIGRGSYGEVWMARNVLGESRAVKIIYRRAFEHERPYEREFDGIRRFVPISRTHPSQLSVLHVGRNDPAGYFYYVMELGDDAWREEVGGKKPNPGPYLYLRGRVPIPRLMCPTRSSGTLTGTGVCRLRFA
jgi:hypothetical protein